MDNGFTNNVIAIPTVSTRGILLSTPYKPHYPLSISSKSKCTERKHTTFAFSIRNHVSLGPKLIEFAKHKLNYGARILPFGHKGKMFRKSFNTRDSEKLLHTSHCSIYTTAGAIAGNLFISTERVGFCSDRSLKTYSTSGELLKFQYKVSIPLEKIKGARENMNRKRPSNKYVELVTVDDFSFWFLDFPNFSRTLRYLHQSLMNLDSIAN